MSATTARLIPSISLALLMTGSIACVSPAAGPKAAAAGASSTDIAFDVANSGVSARSLDVLLVVDTASSACYLQQQLIHNINQWIQRFTVDQAGRKRSIRVATTTDTQFRGDQAGAPLVPGQLTRLPNKFAPLSCVASKQQPCTNGTDCGESKCYSPGPNSFSGTCPVTGPCYLGMKPSSSSWICEGSELGPIFPSCNTRSSCIPICPNDEYCVDLFKPIFGSWSEFAYCDSTYSTFGACRLANMAVGCNLDSPPPPILAADPNSGVETLSSLKCLASVGFSSDPNFSSSYRTLASALPGPLAAALAGAAHEQCDQCLLTDPKCSCPTEQFPRREADLLIVVVSQQDDCSLDAGLMAKLNTGPDNKSVAVKLQKMGLLDGRCMLLSQIPTEDSPYWAAKCVVAQNQEKTAGAVQRVCPSDCIALPAGSTAKADCEASAAAVLRAMQPGKAVVSADPVFMATSGFVEAIRATKTSSARIYFAAIIGDSGATTESGRNMARTAYYLDTLMSQATASHIEAYICSEGFGVAMFGARLLAIANEFGPNGIATSLCGNGGVGGALTSVADWFLKVESSQLP